MSVNRLPFTVKRTLCTFCGYGCELGIVFDDFGIRGVEYLKDTPNQGRVCPRGSASAFYLNHSKRLCVPVENGKYKNWEFINQLFREVLKQPDSIAITVDRNVTIEEENTIIGFCKKHKINNIASTYFESEALLKRFIDEKSPVSLDEIEKSQMIIILGDVFNYAPMISKNLINWKLSDRKHRLVVIDSIKTHTSYFATDFLMVRPGTEGLVLLVLAGETLSGINVSEITGIPEKVVERITKDFKSAENGLLIVSMPFAHSYEPQIIAEGVKRFAGESKKKVLPIFEFMHYNDFTPFGRIFDLIKNNKIKYIINFGELFPFYYPQLVNELSQVEIYATSTLRFKDFVQFPVPLNMEKAGTILTISGSKGIGGEIKPANGAKNINELLNIFGVEDSTIEKKDLKVDIKSGAKRIADYSSKKTEGYFRLFGEKVAYYYLGLFDKPILKINPVDAGELGIKQNDIVNVESKISKTKIQVKITNEVPKGVLYTQPEIPEVRGLFEYEIVDDFVNFIPTEVRIWQEE
ncbi:MAG: molybdopterin dinucleotide binding domain-containing protein [candidate division WOR-3 bacterium]